jgi:phosphatidylinositol alpha-mannosyltransferase
LACGAPTVATAVSGSEAIGDAGVLVPPGDAGALAAAVDELLGDPGRRCRLSEAARERSASYDLGSTLRRNLELWARVVRARKARGR